MNDFIFGINYWPRRKAMYWWKEFDPGEVREEWSHVRDLGFSHVRFFLLWEDFQPRPDQVSEQALKNLEIVLNIAGELQLKVMPTLINGNMSGRFWLPQWVKDSNLFTDQHIVKAQKLLVSKVAEKIGTHPALYAWDIANELDQINYPSTDLEGKAWLTHLTNTLHREAPDIPVTYGAHYPSLVTNNGLRVDAMGQVLDIVSIHAWSVYFPVPAEPSDVRTVSFTYELASQLAGKPVILQEFGLPTSGHVEQDRWIDDDFLGETKKIYLASEEKQAHFIVESLNVLRALGCPGAFVWCYADYDEKIWNRPPLDTAKRERFFGIVRPDGREKVVAQQLRELMGKEAKVRVEQRKKVISDAHTYYNDPRGNFSLAWQRYTKK